MMTFEAIYKKYNRQVFRFVKNRIKDEVVAEELTSDVMMKVYKSLYKYDEKIAQLNTWILNIAKNCIIDFFRKKHLTVVSLEAVYVDWRNGEEEAKTDHLTEIGNKSSNPEELLIEKEVMSTMYKKYEALNESEKIISALHYFDGLSYDEVAEQLNMPLGTVKAKLSRARAKLMMAFPVEMRKAVTL